MRRLFWIEFMSDDGNDGTLVVAADRPADATELARVRLATAGVDDPVFPVVSELDGQTSPRVMRVWIKDQVLA